MVIARAKNKQEQVIASTFLLYEMKPREIYERHGDLFENVAQVRRVKDNFLTRLRRDQELRASFEQNAGI